MGYFHYGPLCRVEFDDRMLAHLRTVTIGKFALQESFAFTWTEAGAQRSVWMHPSMHLMFEFDSDEISAIDPAWIEKLIALANSPSGLRLTPGPHGGVIECSD